MSFIDLFDRLSSNTFGENDTATECVSKIPHSDFHLYLLIPASVLYIIISFTIYRKNKLPNFLNGRPGIAFPMDILGKSNRFSYLAAWGSIAYLAAEMVVEQKFALTLTGKYGTIFNAVLSMVIYGINFSPLFAALALESVVGYLVGTLYAWMFFGVNIYKAAECDLASVEGRVVLMLRDLPNLLCLCYLSISLPVRLVQSMYRKSMFYCTASEMVAILNIEKEVDSTPEADHVKKLLQKPRPEPIPPSTIANKILGLIRRFIHAWVYQRRKGFRYSTRVLSVMFVGGLLLYKLTLELMVIVLSILRLVEAGFLTTLEIIGYEYETGEDETIATLRELTYTLYYVVMAGRVCFIVSMSVACAFGFLTILHMLHMYRGLDKEGYWRRNFFIHALNTMLLVLIRIVSLRRFLRVQQHRIWENLFALYRGDNSFIRHRSERSNPSLMVGSMKYAGFQVGYIAWGFIIQFVILLIVTLALATVITLIIEGYYQWLLDILSNGWPALLVTIVITTFQFILAKVLFLQGNDLAIDNRRLLFCVTFFFFFYNIFLGLISCLLRIIKSIAFGTLFMSRLDHSALSRRFEMIDPGFSAYVGFIQVEATHTHPVLVMFLRYLMLARMKSESEIEPEGAITIQMNGSEKKPLPKTGSNKRARTRWFLLLTLYNNPALRASRKNYINFLREMRERLMQRYNLSNSAIGDLMTGMTSGMNNVNMSDVNVNVDENGDVSSAPNLMNMNAMFAMSRFMMALQKQAVNTDGGSDPVGELASVFGGRTNKAFEVDEQAPPTKKLWKRAAGKAFLQSSMKGSENGSVNKAEEEPRETSTDL